MLHWAICGALKLLNTHKDVLAVHFIWLSQRVWPIHLIKSPYNLSISRKDHSLSFDCRKCHHLTDHLKYKAELEAYFPNESVFRWICSIGRDQHKLWYRRWKREEHEGECWLPLPSFWTLPTQFGDKVTALIFKQSVGDGIGSLSYHHHTRAGS